VGAFVSIGRQGQNEGREREHNSGAPNQRGGARKSPNNVTSTFFNTVHLLPEDLGFEHGAPSNLVTTLLDLSLFGFRSSLNSLIHRYRISLTIGRSLDVSVMCAIFLFEEFDLLVGFKPR